MSGLPMLDKYVGKLFSLLEQISLGITTNTINKDMTIRVKVYHSGWHPADELQMFSLTLCNSDIYGHITFNESNQAYSQGCVSPYDISSAQFIN